MYMYIYVYTVTTEAWLSGSLILRSDIQHFFFIVTVGLPSAWCRQNIWIYKYQVKYK